MEFRPLVPWGLALVVSAGCQSYYPNGYGHNGPYSTFPGGTYVPSTTMPPANSGGATRQYPTPVNGRNNLQPDAPAAGSSKTVPKYRTPDGAPNDLGAPGSDDELNSIKKRGTSSRGKPGTAADDPTDDAGDAFSSIDDERFVSPVEYRSSAAANDARGSGRVEARSVPSPYKKDPNGYSWLRGVVARDPKSGAWQLTYSRDDGDDDPYGGTLTLLDDEALDILKDGDVILVEGGIDRSSPDRHNRPSYRVDRLTPLKPRDS